MKNSTYKNLSEILRTKVVLGVAAGLLLVSCGSQMGGYTETDGVYYDPNKDVIPEGIVMPEPNQVDEVYAYDSDSASIIEQNQQNQAAQKNKYQTTEICLLQSIIPTAVRLLFRRFLIHFFR